MSGSAKETEVTLNRGTNQRISSVTVTFTAATAGDKIQLLRKDSASTSNERDDSHADSKGVLIAEGYVSNGTLDLEPYLKSSATSGRNEKLRVYVNSTATGTVYLNIKYDY